MFTFLFWLAFFTFCLFARQSVVSNQRKNEYKQALKEFEEEKSK